MDLRVAVVRGILEEVPASPVGLAKNSVMVVYIDLSYPHTHLWIVGVQVLAFARFSAMHRESGTHCIQSLLECSCYLQQVSDPVYGT